MQRNRIMIGRVTLGLLIAGLLWTGPALLPEGGERGLVSCACADEATEGEESGTEKTGKAEARTKSRKKSSDSCERTCTGKERLRTHPIFKYANPVFDWVLWGVSVVVTYIVFLLIFAMLVRRGGDPLPIAAGCFALTLLLGTVEAAAVFGYRTVEKVDGKCWCTVWAKSGLGDILTSFRWEIWGSAMGAAAVIALLLWLTFRRNSRG